jgi:hypothetical protein
MEDPNEDKKLIDKLINKRKQENVAFTKLLHAIENKGTEANESRKLKSKKKS